MPSARTVRRTAAMLIAVGAGLAIGSVLSLSPTVTVVLGLGLVGLAILAADNL